MIRFLYRGGSQATREALYRSIRANIDAGEQALLLVPEQETVSTERRMLELLPPAAQLSFEVLNFSRLANRTFRTLGGLSYRAASPAASALLMWRTLTSLAPFLKQYQKNAAEDINFCDAMLSTEKQCKAYCITPDALLQAAEALSEGEPLADKLSDLATVLSAYQHALNERFDDPLDDLTRLANLLSGEGKWVFADTHIYIDSFTDFTAQELAVLRALFACAPSVTVCFALSAPNEVGLHLASPEATHRRLLRMARELDLPVEYDKGKDERADGALSYFSKYLFDMSAEPAPLGFAEDGQISYTLCPTPFDEAKAAAATIHRLVRSGARYRDIAVVMRDATAWQGILDAALEKEGIPYFLSEKTDITVRPLIKLILEALRIYRYGWRREDIIGYLKTGLCGISDNDINLFEEYTSVWKPRGKAAYCSAPFYKNPDGYTDAVSERGARILEAANRVREAFYPPLLHLFEALEQAQTMREQASALYAFLCELQIADTLRGEAEARLLEGERREAEELSRLYEVTVGALEDISDALGDEPADISSFTEALRLVFARTDIGVIPTSTDEVTLGSASMLRADHPRFVLLLGLNEGEFPKTVSDDGLLGDAEKQRLAALGISFPGDLAELSSDELFFLWRAVSSPRDGLFLFRSEFSAAGKAQSPSIALERLRSLFPTLKPARFSPTDPLSHIYTPEGALDYWDEQTPAVREALLTLLSPNTNLPLQALSAPAAVVAESISAERAQQIFASYPLSPTHIESYASCPFSYYCEKVLKLRTEATGELDYLASGNFLHYALEKVLDRVKREGRGFADYTPDEQHDMVRAVTTEYLSTLTRTGLLSLRTHDLFHRLCALAEVVVEGLFDEFTDSDFTPAFLELDLAAGGRRPTLTLQDGTTVPLTGKIDRVDFFKDESGRAFVRIVDYKTGSRAFSPEDISRGFSLQMPLYLMALCRNKQPRLCKELGIDPDTMLLPAGVTYLSSAIGSETTPTRKPHSEAMSDAVKRLARHGVVLDDPVVKNALSHKGNTAMVGGKTRAMTALSPEGFSAIFDQLTDTVVRISGDMKSGRASAEPQTHDTRVPCSVCRFAAVCRVAKK